MIKFGGIPDEYANFQSASILLQSIPYDGTSTWGKGADEGFPAFIEASENMELYDIETDSEVYQKGIHIPSAITENATPERVYQTVFEQTNALLETGKYLTFMGGEHSVSIGIIEAFRLRFKDLTVLQLDAHADLRPTYLGSAYNHACALHKASLETNLIQVGIRSMDSCEKPFLNPDKVFLAESIHATSDWIDKSI